MVKKLEQWREVEKRRGYIQIDELGFDLFLITLFEERVQYVCDVEHLIKMYVALSESKIL